MSKIVLLVFVTHLLLLWWFRVERAFFWFWACGFWLWVARIWILALSQLVRESWMHKTNVCPLKELKVCFMERIAIGFVMSLVTSIVVTIQFGTAQPIPMPSPSFTYGFFVLANLFQVTGIHLTWESPQSDWDPPVYHSFVQESIVTDWTSGIAYGSFMVGVALWRWSCYMGFYFS